MGKKWLAALLCLCCVLLFAVLAPQTARADEVANGDCGDNMTWSLDDAGRLVISGAEQMWDFIDPADVPWYDMDISEVYIDDGVTSIGGNAFADCSELKSITIPEGVTSIGVNAFADCSMLASIRIPSSVTSIGAHAFGGCGSMTSIRIPEGVTSIEDSTFLCCGSLASIRIPSSVTSIGAHAFETCSALNSIGIPEGVTSIGENAFWGCSELKSITIPYSVTSIGANAFQNCVGLTDIWYDGTEEMWNAAVVPEGNAPLFNAAVLHHAIGCGDTGDCRWVLQENGLLKILCSTDCGSNMDPYVPGGAPWYQYRDQITGLFIGRGIQSIGPYSFCGQRNLQTVTGMESVTSIGENAFWGCMALNSITIPYSMTRIEANAFLECGILSEVWYDGTQQQWNEIAVDSAGNDELIAGLRFPIALGDTEDCRWVLQENGLLKILGSDDIFGPGDMDQYTAGGAPWYQYRDQITGLFIGNGVRRIGANSFYQLESLKKVTGMEDVISLGDLAFCDCAELTGIVLPDGLIDMGDSVFAGCTKLTSAGPAGSDAAIEFGWMDEIPNLAFSGADCLKSVVLPEGIIRIGEDAFYGCLGLETVTLPESLEEIGAAAFESCESLTTAALQLSDGLTRIDSYAFSSCIALETVTLPASLAEIDWNVFAGCTKLTSAGPAGSGAAIEFGWTDEIPSLAFSGADCLKSVVLPEGIIRIGDNAFSECVALTNVILPASLAEIGWNVFADCDQLTSAGPASSGAAIEFGWMDIIPDNAFSGANCLASVALPGGILRIGESAFCDCITLANVGFPASLEEIGAFAFLNCASLESVALPEHVHRIRNDAFSRCVALTNVSLPASLAEIEWNVFADCGQLTTAGPADSGAAIEFGWTNEIPENAFSGANCLESVTLPESITRIGECAFCDCTGLQEVQYGSSLAKWAMIAIGSNNEPLDSAQFIYSKYDVTIGPDGGTGNVPPETVDGGSNYLLPPADIFIAPSGKQFKEWSVKIGDEEAMSLQPGDLIVITANTTITAVWEDLPAPAFGLHKMNLDGKIGIQFQIRLPENFDTTGCYMSFSASDGTSAAMQLSAAEKESDTSYYFTCYVNALELADTITPTFHYDGDKTVTGDGYRAVDYFTSAHTVYGSNDKMMALIDALQNYGHYLQATGWTDGASHAAISRTAELSAADITAATTGVAGYGVTKTLGDGMDAKIALVLNAQTVLRVYVKPKDGAAVITPCVADEVIGSDTYYVYETAPIGPLHLGSDQTVTVETSDGSATVTASAMSYVKAMLEWASATDAQKLAMTAYYNYYQAALAYSN